MCEPLIWCGEHGANAFLLRVLRAPRRVLRRMADEKSGPAYKAADSKPSAGGGRTVTMEVVAGNGRDGTVDSPLLSACEFKKPLGLCRFGDSLIVCCRTSHTVRLVEGVLGEPQPMDDGKSGPVTVSEYEKRAVPLMMAAIPVLPSELARLISQYARSSGTHTLVGSVDCRGLWMVPWLMRGCRTRPVWRWTKPYDLALHAPWRDADAALSADADVGVLYVAADNGVHVCYLTMGLRQFWRMPEHPSGLALTSDGRWLFAVSAPSVQIFDTRTGARTIRGGFVTRSRRGEQRLSSQLGCVLDPATQSLAPSTV
jgi:hypothetical protein